MVPNTESEKHAAEWMMHGMLSASFLLNFTDQVLSPKRNTITIGEFYDGFNKTHDSQRFRPFNEGVVLGYLYWLMYAKENWQRKHLIPNDHPSIWGIAPIRWLSPKRPQTLTELIRGIRNALGHRAPTFHVPNNTTFENIRTNVTITFNDGRKDHADTFEAELTLGDALELTKKLQEIVHNDVAQRHGVVPPAK